MNINAIIQQVLAQIDPILTEHESQKIPLLDFLKQRNWLYLASFFSKKIREQTYIVLTKGAIPSFHIPMLPPSANNPEDAIGITLKDTIFIQQKHCADFIVFHELIHIIQWNALGPEAFVRTYGLYLLLQGYHNHPLEEIAYSWEKRFRETPPTNFEDIISSHALLHNERALKLAEQWM